MIGTDDLRSEHVGVMRMLGILDSMAGHARRGERVDADDLAGAIEFLQVFVDRCHHTKEEELLFPALRDAGVTSAENTITRLLADHVSGRDGVARIAEAAQRFGGGDGSANVELALAIDAYTTLLRAHIEREERDCFELADRELAASVQEELADGYERIEREVVGGGVHERFHALLDSLARAYHA